ncbi:MAG: conjugal transfer protein TraX [Lachnospiraceae bacterium]|nr:conjugal transfer protein TraX [Lachnospiraceae bacterium]
MERLWSGISGSTLKVIAIVTMLIDHIGAVILERWLVWNAVTSGTYSYDPQVLMVNQVLRSIGRVSFPIFCFLLTEGFLHTSSVVRYAVRLACFALLSEIPFNLAISGSLFSGDYQNIFFTLLIGLLVMIFVDFVWKRCGTKIGSVLLGIGGIGLGMLLAEFLRTDYGAKGIIGIIVIYLFRQNSAQQALAGALAFCWELPAPLGFLPVAFYNGRRGWRMKYVFYWFYPVHLLILYGIACCMGIG